MSEPASGHRLPLTSASLEHLFNACFGNGFNTCLQGGANEPFYAAARAGSPAVIHYRHDYFSSALHEIAHWCIAGAARLKLDDFGYWYAADGRDPEQQREFEQVEVKPQALEKLFTEACGLVFRVSVDNLALPDYDASAFASRVDAQARHWLETGTLPPRAVRWLQVLRKQFGSES